MKKMNNITNIEKLVWHKACMYIRYVLLCTVIGGTLGLTIAIVMDHGFNYIPVMIGMLILQIFVAYQRREKYLKLKEALEVAQTILENSVK